MSDPDWDLSAGFAGTKYYGPSTWAIGITGAPSAWRAQGPQAR